MTSINKEGPGAGLSILKENFKNTKFGQDLAANGITVDDLFKGNDNAQTIMTAFAGLLYGTDINNPAKNSLLGQTKSFVE